MNISELEARTGITKQNIRFYEKRGLLHPVRNAENNYREYTEEDVRTLQNIKVLLDMDRMEKEGGRFMAIINDYKKVSKAQARKRFTFTPDTMVKNEREFTEALLQYADQNNLNLVITKESMYPVFEIDGVEYTAVRQWAPRLLYRPLPVAYIVCTMTHPEDAADDADVPEGRRRLLRWLHRHMGAVVLIVGLLILNPDILAHWWGWALLIALVPIAVWGIRIGE